MKNRMPTKSTRHHEGLTRRSVLGGIGLVTMAPLVASFARAEQGSTPAPSQLPLRTSGLEHMGTVVPDVAAAGRFYGRLFNPELHKEKDPPLRYYVTLGVGYLALGSRANEPRAFFDHFCALVQDYDGKAMAQELQSNGLPAGRFGIIPDPDGLGLQLLGVPGGLAKSTEPAGRIVEGDSLVKPIGLSQVVLQVADLDRSLAFYRRFFGAESTNEGGRAVFDIVGTRLALETAKTGEPARIDRITVKVHPFDRAAVSRELAKLGANVQSEGRGGSSEALRFRDPIGLGLELLPA